MTGAPVTSLYAALLSVLFVVLSARVIVRRRSGRVSLGVRGNPGLERAARVHANFAEYVPFALVLMLLAELDGTPRPALHAAGLILLLARLAHAWGMAPDKEDFRFRVAGIATTLTLIGALALALLVAVIQRLS